MIESTLKEMRSFARASNKASGIRSMLSLARSDLAILPTGLDTDPWLLNVQNGTLDLRTGQLRPHDTDDFITKLCPVDYDPDATAPQWQEFLREIFAGDDELIGYIQRLVGYCLTGSTQEHILSILHGVGANGKSTFIDASTAMLGPDYAMTAPHDLLLAKQSSSHPTEQADLFGKRLVACSETGDGRRLAESLVKTLTGGDRIRARRMREDFWEFSPTHKILLATNHRPDVRGTDHGLWRRIKLIPFDVTIPDDQQDKELPDKLRAESPGILAWAVKGCRQWQADGLGEPHAVASATSEYRIASDAIQQFVNQQCDSSPVATVSASSLYRAYRSWCQDVGEEAVNQTRFGSRLTELGYAKRKSGIVYRVGIRLRPLA